MSKISEAEARLLLSRPLRCEGDVVWKPQRNGREGCILSVGLLDDTGAATAMVVELTYIHNVTTGRTKYLFSVFIRYRYGPRRVYQLEVTQASRDRKNIHGRSHEHIGDLRSMGHALWQHWSYHEVLAHFCARTNITFDPFPPSP